MSVARWIVAVGLIGAASVLAMLNWRVFWRRHVRHVHASSWVPLLAGVLGAGGLLLVPIEPVRRSWWLPFLLDWGGAPGLIYTVAWHVQRLRRRSTEGSAE